MDISKLTYESLNNYYKTLADTGYLEDTQVNKLLLLTFINDLFRDDTSWYITTEDYDLLISIINCISKSTCIVPYMNIASHIEPINNYLEDLATRVSEYDIIRLTENDLTRIADL